MLQSLSVIGQESNEYVTNLEDRVVYDTHFFDRYSPQTAYDMVKQVPGFTLFGDNRGNNNQARGLGLGEGNLLIGGKRPNTKDDSAPKLLERIPAINVISLEILSKGSTELAGQSGQIVNVIVKESEKINGSWKFGVHELENGVTEPRFEISLAGKLNNFSYTTGLEIEANEFPQWGPEKYYDASNNLLEIRDDYQSYFEEGVNFNLGVAWDNYQGDLINFNFSGRKSDSIFYEHSDRHTPLLDGGFGALLREVDFGFNEEEWRYELGADYAKDLNSGVLKIVALRRYEKSDEDSLFQNLEVVDSDYEFGSDSISIETEHVLRGLYTIVPKEGHNLEFALELVENNLDTSVDYFEDTGSGRQTVQLTGSDIEVNEERAEISLQYSRPVFNDWTLQALFASEYSEISVSGPDTEPNSDSFTRAKGFIAFNGPLNENTRLRTRLERSVGQLNFFDFASSQNVNEGTTRGGNTKLVPDQTWRAEVSLEYDFTDQDKLTVTGFAESIDDFITFIPFEDGSEGRGNIDDFKQHGIDINASIAMDRFGLKGGKLDINAEFHKTKMRDPITGESREFRVNGYRPLSYQIDLRQDIPNTSIAWGATLIERSGNIAYRQDRVSVFDHAYPQAHILFVEHKDIAGLTVRLEVEDFLGFTYENRREFYEGNRNGSLLSYEENRRHSPWIARLGVSGNF